MTAAGKAHSKDVRVWGGTRGDGVGNNGFPHERGGWVLGYSSCEGGLEGMRNGGEFSTKVERKPTRRAAWVQVRDGYGNSDLGGEVDTEVGRDCTRAAVPGFPGYA